MHPKVMAAIHGVVRDSGLRARRALEVGGRTGPRSLLRAPEIEPAERYCLNLTRERSRDGVTAVVGNANHMDMFEDGSFDLVLCNATLEHDRSFWLSLAEMKRVLRRGGLLVIGVPGFVRDPQRDRGRRTITYKVHYRFDYYRFSEQAVREVFFDGMERVDAFAILVPPRIIGHGYKPA
jgi:SAM-dependent methyltransferase